MFFERLMLAGTLGILAGCQMPEQTVALPAPPAHHCEPIAHFEDEASLLLALPGLYEEYHRDLIVISGSVFASACSSEHLGGASEESRIAGVSEESRIGSVAEKSRLGSAGENSRLGSQGEQSRIDSAGEASRIGSQGEQSRLASEREDSRLGSDGENSRLGSKGEASRLESVGEQSRLASEGEQSRLGSAATRLTCVRAPNELGYALNTPAHRRVRIFDGVTLWFLVDGRLLDDPSAPVR